MYFAARFDVLAAVLLRYRVFLDVIMVWFVVVLSC